MRFVSNLGKQVRNSTVQVRVLFSPFKMVISVRRGTVLERMKCFNFVIELVSVWEAAYNQVDLRFF